MHREQDRARCRGDDPFGRKYVYHRIHRTTQTWSKVIIALASRKVTHATMVARRSQVAPTVHGKWEATRVLIHISRTLNVPGEIYEDVART
jgi:hypothetical protein